ncbi:MAG: RNA polymerase sigma factor [Saprospiraceae bacterium]
MTEDKNFSRLLAGCLKHKESSQIELYRLFYSYGMGVCLRYARNRESAMEMLNDGFLKVFTKIDQYKPSQAFKPWLRKILVNAAIDHYRKYEERKPETYASEEVEGAPSYNVALDQLEFDDLLQIMQHLPAAYQMTFNLYVVEGLTHAEIANQLGTSVGTSKSNLSKARGKIKELLKDYHDIHLKSDSYG